MNNFEKDGFDTQESDSALKEKSTQELKTEAISRYINKIITNSESLDISDEEEIKKYYDTLVPRERADELYVKIMAYISDKREWSNASDENEEQENESAYVPDKHLISEIKVLFNDKKVQKMIPDTYGEARVDTRNFQNSDITTSWEKVTDLLSKKSAEFKMLEQELHLGKISGKGSISSAKSRMKMLARDLSELDVVRNDLSLLRGYERTRENTDVAAAFQFQKLKEYKSQLEDGFVWLPSRLDIHQQTVSSILNHRWPVLIGEAGSGKSEQADAAAKELTGELPTEVECESVTGEVQLIKDVAIGRDGGSYEKYGSLMQAFTGFKDSKQESPDFKHGRIVRFDESGRLGPRAYAIIKKARQQKAGDDFYGRLVLPGASAIWTSNPVGPRYPDRHAPDPAMRRELSEISVDYPDMSIENPELYEFALTALFDENDHISVSHQELAPAYTKVDLPDDKKTVLQNGSVIVAKDEIVSDISDSNHGALWRFCGAVKSLQESFVYGNSDAKEYPETLLRFRENSDDVIEVVTDEGGEVLTLSSSTITLGELSSWMSGYNERRQKQDQEFHTETLEEWLDLKIKTYIRQADKADKEKIQAIFKHFHFLDDIVADISSATSVTPKQIGYLSPRVPRPVYLDEANVDKKNTPSSSVSTLESSTIYETVQVILEGGERINVDVAPLTLRIGQDDEIVINPEDTFTVNKKQFSFSGIVEGKSVDSDGGIVGKLDQEELHATFSKVDIEKGRIVYVTESVSSEIDGNVSTKWEEYWNENCKT